mmetsp:Transcript_70149/g.221525  ORF Transcript_70149/g.221525 Transcript_70149/m.221525 type:complete len:221 (+) Transcript_70149:123-785(+)
MGWTLPSRRAPALNEGPVQGVGGLATSSGASETAAAGRGSSPGLFLASEVVLILPRPLPRRLGPRIRWGPGRAGRQPQRGPGKGWPAKGRGQPQRGPRKGWQLPQDPPKMAGSCGRPVAEARQWPGRHRSRSAKRQRRPSPRRASALPAPAPRGQERRPSQSPPKHQFQELPSQRPPRRRPRRPPSPCPRPGQHRPPEGRRARPRRARSFGPCPACGRPP